MTSWKLKQIFVYFLLLSMATVFANTPQELFDQANNAYNKGQYTKAIEQYEAILASEEFSTEIYYNLGNAYWKNKKLGKAVLNFERVLKLSPNDNDTAYNLAIVQEQLVDDLDIIGTFFLKKWWQSFYQSLSSTAWSILTLLAVWGSVGGLIVWLLGKERDLKKKGFIGGLILLGVSLLLFFAARSQGHFETNSQQAIVLETSIDLKNGPDPQSTKLITIHEGLKVDLLDKIGSWYKVKLSNGEQGWLPITSLEEI